jgi:hypothetical protein
LCFKLKCSTNINDNEIQLDEIKNEIIFEQLKIDKNNNFFSIECHEIDCDEKDTNALTTNKFKCNYCNKIFYICNEPFNLPEFKNYIMEIYCNYCMFNNSLRMNLKCIVEHDNIQNYYTYHQWMIHLLNNHQNNLIVKMLFPKLTNVMNDINNNVLEGKKKKKDKNEIDDDTSEDEENVNNNNNNNINENIDEEMINNIELKCNQCNLLIEKYDILLEPYLHQFIDRINCNECIKSYNNRYKCFESCLIKKDSWIGKQAYTKWHDHMSKHHSDNKLVLNLLKLKYCNEINCRKLISINTAYCQLHIENKLYNNELNDIYFVVAIHY